MRQVVIHSVHCLINTCCEPGCKKKWGWAGPSLAQDWLARPSSCLFVMSSSCEVKFLRSLLPVRSSSSKVIFLSGCLPLRSSSYDILFLWACLPVIFFPSQFGSYISFQFWFTPSHSGWPELLFYEKSSGKPGCINLVEFVGSVPIAGGNQVIDEFNIQSSNWRV